MSEVLIRESDTLICLRKFLHKMDAILTLYDLLQVGYAEKMANVWAKVAEETSQYNRESS